MMKFEKLVKGGLAAVMALSMAACSGSGSSADTSTPAANDGAATDAAAAPAETTAAAGAFKLGLSGPLTGGASVYGQAVKNAAEIAVEEINAKGGVQFELTMEDDEHDAEKAVNAYNALKDWGMQISLLTVTSAPGAAVAQMYQDAEPGCCVCRLSQRKPAARLKGRYHL